MAKRYSRDSEDESDEARYLGEWNNRIKKMEIPRKETEQNKRFWGHVRALTEAPQRARFCFTYEKMINNKIINNKMINDKMTNNLTKPLEKKCEKSSDATGAQTKGGGGGR